MNDARASDEALLAVFVKELEESAEPDAVVARYRASCPALADEFATLAAMIQRIDRSRPDDEEALPQHLGDFLLGRRLDQGGMGEVYEALQERLQRRVAVKIIRRGRTSPVHRARFLREQMVLARLHHTHIVPILAAGEVGSLQYFVMPYIDGVALHRVVEAARLAGKVEPPLPFPVPLPGTKHPGDYFRFVARVLADVAEALQHAHDAGILHRDVKPSNIMVDRSGACWIIDFGLAGRVGRPGSAHAAPSAIDLGPDPLTASAAVGTPRYMAPEQYRHQADERTDVWGLGATLYELLTLRRAFDGATEAEVRQQVESSPPLPPRQVAPSVPGDLAAICLKALDKEPARRYPSAGDFGDDLRRWLRGEATRACPPWPPRRLGLWARRSKGWAAALAVFLVGGIALAGLLVASARKDARGRWRESRLQQLQVMSLPPHSAGWSALAWETVAEVAAVSRDEALRDRATPVLTGLDARLARLFNRFDAYSVAFSADGRHLLMGGADGSKARQWDSRSDEERLSSRSGAGPVAWTPAGRRLQLVVDPRDRLTLRLWDVDGEQESSLFRIAESGNPEPSTDANRTVLALSANGARLAASTTLPDGRPVLVVWEAASGKRTCDLAIRASALAFAPDGGHLAAATEGRIAVWSLPEVKPVAALKVGRSLVHCLAFGRRGARSRSLLLAAGDAGGAATVWDLSSGHPLSFCRGSHYDVFAVALSPDGTTLLTAGRSSPRLWDVATGRLLLHLTGASVATGAAFSPDGRRLAISSLTAFESPGGVQVLDLEEGRGVRLLRGLSGQLARVGFSPDGRLLAGLAHDWQVGLWDRSTGQLLHVLDAPQGLLAEHGGFAFDAAGRRFACAADRQARLWDVASGAVRGSWDLPQGIINRLAFHEPRQGRDQLLLVRAETQDPRIVPLKRFAFEEVLRAWRIRDLLGPRPVEPIAETTEHSRRAYDALGSPDGRYFVLAGRGGTDGLRQSLLVCAASSGKERWSFFPERPARALVFAADPAVTRLAIHPTVGGEGVRLAEVATGKTLGSLPFPPQSVHPRAEYVGQRGSTGSLVWYGLYRWGESHPVLRLGMAAPGISTGSHFSPDGRHLALGNDNGSITLCDLAAVRGRLALVGLGW